MASQHDPDDYLSFDPSKDDKPFRRRQPQLPPEATERERELAAKYTRISFALVPDDEHREGCIPDATNAWLVVENQQFRITEPSCDDRDNASWYCWMITKVLEKILLAETQSTSHEATAKHCPTCGYTKEDCNLHLDHNLCESYPYFPHERTQA